MYYYRPTPDEINAVKRRCPNYDDLTAYREARTLGIGRLLAQEEHRRKVQANIDAYEARTSREGYTNG